MRFIIVISLILNIAIYSQIVNKVLVSGISGYEEHDENVKNAFLQGYASYNGSVYEGEITLYPYNINLSFEHASENNYQMIVRSTTGLSTGIHYADLNPEIKLVMPAGSNSFVQAYSGDIEVCPVIVTGAGNSKNVTGFNIDFYSIDPITDNNYSSFSNGYVAGQIAYISNSLNCSIDEALIKAREKGTEYGVWDEHNGFGEINIEATLSEAFPVELTSFTATLVSSATIILNWATATEVNNYGFEVQRMLSGVEAWETVGFVKGHGNSNSPKEYSYVDATVAERSRSYRLKQIDNDGDFECSDVVTVTNNLTKTVLLQNYPNPFNPSTVIKYEIDEARFVNLNIYNLLGENVATLVNRNQNAGSYEIVFDASANNFASGFYFYTLKVSSGSAISYSKTMKMLLLK